MKDIEKNDLFLARVFDCAKRNLLLSETAKKHLAYSETSVKDKIKEMIGISYKAYCKICSKFSVFNYAARPECNIDIAKVLDNLKINGEYKAFATCVRCFYHTTTSTIIKNIKEGDQTMKEEVHNIATSTDNSAIDNRVGVFRVIEALNNSSKDSPITLQGLKIVCKNPRRYIVFLRRLGVPIISAFGRKGGYYIATKDNQDIDEASCLSILIIGE